MRQRKEIVEMLNLVGRPAEGEAKVKEYEQRIAREVYKFKRPRCSGESVHYRSGWDDAIEFVFELLKTLNEPESLI